ncbi:hypothetical protein AB6A40_009595 [Gnathostoma spinigerum]|uniref:Hexosyltransferase n=1 Tax=Gnathostoma spinigerum TaxID=75299 RepID=A0ABD6EZE8_9BILA
MVLLTRCGCETNRYNSKEYDAMRNGMNPKFIVDGENRNSPSTYLLILIMSRANDSSSRVVIRDTWLKLSAKGKSTLQHLFPIGTVDISSSQLEFLREEQSLFGDLLLLDDLKDVYSNLTRKTLMAIDAAVKQFNFKFLLKVDSDSFVRLGALLKGLKDIEHPYLYWGFLDGRAKPMRKGKWAERDWIMCDRYLPYQLGGGYVLSYRLAKFLSDNKDLLHLYRWVDSFR